METLVLVGVVVVGLAVFLAFAYTAKTDPDEQRENSIW